MSKDSQTVEDKHKELVRAIVVQLKNEIALAKAKGSAAIAEVMVNIEASNLPINELNDLKADADKAQLQVSGKEKTNILEANVQVIDNAKKLLEPAEVEKNRYETEIKPIYDIFNSFHADFLKEKEAQNEKLGKLSDRLAAGEKINDEDIKLLIPTPEEIERERVRLAWIERTRKTATKELEYHAAEKAKNDQMIRELSGLPETPSTKVQVAQLQKANKFHDSCSTGASTHLEEIAKSDDVRSKECVKFKEVLEQWEVQGVSDEHKTQRELAQARLNRLQKASESRQVVSKLTIESPPIPEPQKIDSDIVSKIDKHVVKQTTVYSEQALKESEQRKTLTKSKITSLFKTGDLDKVKKLGAVLKKNGASVQPENSNNKSSTSTTRIPTKVGKKNVGDDIGMA